MKSVRVPLDQENRCHLPSKCVCCGGSDDLRYSEETLKASNPLQLVCVLPWVFVGPALKTEPGSIFLVLLLSVAIFASLSIKVRISIPRCEDCLMLRSAKYRNAAVLFFMGLLAISTSILVVHEAMLPLGFLLAFTAILYAAFAARRFSVRLSRLHGDDAVLLMPMDTTES